MAQKAFPKAGRPHKTAGAKQPPRTSGVLSGGGTVRDRAGVDTLVTAFGVGWSGSDNAPEKFPSDPKPSPQGGSGS
jgi:hypothetical protein